MTLSQSSSDAARLTNSNTEVKAGKPKKQAWAIGCAVQKDNGGKDSAK